jgi:hypothetical protein
MAVGDPNSGAGAGFTVSRVNVLQLGRAFADEASRLQERLRVHSTRIVTEPARGDPASADFATALNAKLVRDPDSYLNRAQDYIDELTKLAEQCAAAAKAYGFTDGQIASAMSGIGAGASTRTGSTATPTSCSAPTTSSCSSTP